MIRSTFDLAKTFAAVAILASVSSAATSWSTPSGSSSTISYTGGQTANGLFVDGSPTVADDKFVFFPGTFEADNGTGGFATDTLSFIVNANSGRSLTSISTGLTGDWSLLGGGSVNVTGILKLTNLATSVVLTQNLTFTPSMPSTLADGSFNGSTLINLPAGWTSAKVELTGNLSTPSVSPTAPQFAGLIQLKEGDIAITTAQVAAVPLPAALLGAPLAMGMAWYVRRRKSR